MEKQIEKKVYMVYGFNSLNTYQDIQRIWYITENYEAVLNIVKNNITDLAENGYYPFMAIQPLTIDCISPDNDPIEIFQWSRKTNKFYYIGYYNTFVSTEDEYGFQYITKELKEFADISDFFKD